MHSRLQQPMKGELLQAWQGSERAEIHYQRQVVHDLCVACQQPQAQLCQAAEPTNVSKVPLRSPQLTNVGSGQEEQPLNLVQTATLTTSLMCLSLLCIRTAYRSLTVALGQEILQIRRQRSMKPGTQFLC